MQLLWQESWMETSGYDVPDVAVLIEVKVMVALLHLEHASGRVTRRPYRKVATFLWTDGPRSTLRKVRTKRGETTFTGDFRVAVILGWAIPSRKPVVALGCRVPPAAQQIPVHERLVREVADEFSSDDLSRVASFLASKHDILARTSRQSFLYSATEPPMELVDLLDEAIGQRNLAFSAPPDGFSAALISPPKGSSKAADTALQLGPPRPSSGLPVALLGAGDYARTEIIPALRAAGLSLHSVANREPQIAAMVAREHGFSVATTNSERAIAELPRSGLVVIATAHDSHARLASVAVKQGHRAFVEKPPAVTYGDVALLVEAMTARPGAIEIGFNRRYHPLIRRARTRLQQEQGPTSITCTIKEITLEPDHWYFWPNQGTRITGNLCHWIDLAVFLLEGRPVPVSMTLSPEVSSPAQATDEERVITVTFEDGSLLTILATSRGDDIRGVQEQIEIRKGQTTVMIDDLWKMRVRRGGVDHPSRTLFRNKAHGAMYRTALRQFLRGEPAAYPPGDMVVVSAIQIAASESARNGELQGEIPAWLRPTLQVLA
jgi:predicted dehydrogenase